MEKKVFVKIEGGKERGITDQTYTWGDDDADIIFAGAINFAEGFVTALMTQGFSFEHPLVMQIDGYWWSCGTLSIEVVNEADKVVRKAEDL